MKFTCERCDAQYMISDDKVGPNGVKVRCKKCSNVILVRHAAENGAVAAEAPAGAATEGAEASATPVGTGEHSLERELGDAFDQAFGEPAAASSTAPGDAAAAPAGGDPDATQQVSADEAARLGASSGSPAADPEPPASEWYVAIGQAQVGPLPLAEVKRKWEAGDVGPDSLVWRPGMGDWAPLSTMSDLAAYLAPVPRSPRVPARAEPAAAARAEPMRTPAPAAAPTAP
ncbi:GYF domain-containing protein, partial [Anaeromyxobacter oryzisoli]|uniref:GYF domain-containing protein n=1 Tax=Anaeromyxobacter oryzisoli TaxID=2925408 RepID=UPI001F56F663